MAPFLFPNEGPSSGHGNKQIVGSAPPVGGAAAPPSRSRTIRIFEATRELLGFATVWSNVLKIISKSPNNGHVNKTVQHGCFISINVPIHLI